MYDTDPVALGDELRVATRVEVVGQDRVKWKCCHAVVEIKYGRDIFNSRALVVWSGRLGDQIRCAESTGCDGT